MWFSPPCHWTLWEKSQRNELVPHQETVFSGEYIWGKFPIQQGVKAGRGFLSKSLYNAANQLQVTHSAGHLFQVGGVFHLFSENVQMILKSFWKGGKETNRTYFEDDFQTYHCAAAPPAGCEDTLHQTRPNRHRKAIFSFYHYLTSKTIIWLHRQYVTFLPKRQL